MRIVGGSWRGRRLVGPRGSHTRPTSDRVREALFSILCDMPEEVLDLYAGTGAVGLEALSRGARSVVFVEHARPALRALEANISMLLTRHASVNAEVFAMRAHAALLRFERADRRFGFVFADPPYAEAARTLPALACDAGGRVAPDGTLVLELSSRDSPPSAPDGFRAPEVRTYGEAALAIYRRSQ